jgi:hypothetical protein
MPQDVGCTEAGEYQAVLYMLRRFAGKQTVNKEEKASLLVHEARGRSPARFAPRFMRRSQLEVLSSVSPHLLRTIQPIPSSSCISVIDSNYTEA